MPIDEVLILQQVEKAKQEILSFESKIAELRIVIRTLENLLFANSTTAEIGDDETSAKTLREKIREVLKASAPRKMSNAAIVADLGIRWPELKNKDNISTLVSNALGKLREEGVSNDWFNFEAGNNGRFLYWYMIMINLKMQKK